MTMKKNINKIILIWTIVQFFAFDIFSETCIENREEVMHINRVLLLKQSSQSVNSLGKNIPVRKKYMKKAWNKYMHSLCGNRSFSKLKIGFWNNKSSQSHKASSTRDNLDLLLKEKNIDIICLSEANILREDEPGEVMIAGFSLITDGLIQKYGRSRSAIYMKENLQHRIRKDLMSNEEPEIWLEIRGGKNIKPLLLVQYYREHSLLRGHKSIIGSERSEEQRRRLIRWVENTRNKILKEDMDVILGGDMNAHIEISPDDNDTDSLGYILKEQFVSETGLEMVVKKITHQEIRNGIEREK